VIAFEHVSKTYRSVLGRRVEAVADISFTIDAGEVVGIAGPNGAGKSTLIALLLGLIRPTSGRITVAGATPRTFAERQGVGYLPELIPVNPVWRADETLTRLAVLAGVPAGDVPARVNEVIARVGLDEHRRKRCKQLSKGNLQKVGLAQSLLTEQRIYVFDEPTHGLDPVWTQQFREIVSELRAPERSMLVASHNLDELERICDRVIIVDRGRIQRVVDVGATDHAEAIAYRVRVAGGRDVFMAAFPGAAELASGEVLVPPIALAALNATLVQAINAGAVIASLQPDKSALEREFNSAVRGQRPGTGGQSPEAGGRS
jgi:ABC-type multidrug transport system ATPase subunit